MSVRLAYFDGGRFKRIDPTDSAQAIDVYGIDINGVSLGMSYLVSAGGDILFANGEGQVMTPNSANQGPILTLQAHAGETAGNKLFVIKDVAGTEIYSVDEDGDVYIAGGETVVGGTTFQGDLSVQGNTTLGDAASDTITLNGVIASDVVPSGSRALGSTTAEWASLYLGDDAPAYFGADQDANIQWDASNGELDITASGANIHMTASTLDLDGNLDVSGTTNISSTTGAIFTVNSDAASGDDDATLRLHVYDGTAAKNWDIFGDGSEKKVIFQYDSTAIMRIDGANEEVELPSQSSGSGSVKLVMSDASNDSSIYAYYDGVGMRSEIWLDVGDGGTSVWKFSGTDLLPPSGANLGSTTDA